MLEGTKMTLGKGTVQKIGVRYVSLCVIPHCFRPFAKRPFGPLRKWANRRTVVCRSDDARCFGVGFYKIGQVNGQIGTSKGTNRDKQWADRAIMGKQGQNGQVNGQQLC